MVRDPGDHPDRHDHIDVWEFRQRRIHLFSILNYATLFKNHINHPADSCYQPVDAGCFLYVGHYATSTFLD